VVNYSLLEVLEEPVQSKTASPTKTNKSCAVCDIATAVFYCEVCKVQLCRECNNMEHSTPVLKRHTRYDLLEQRFRCKVHDRECRYYCLDEKEFICGDCILFGEHNGHHVSRTEDAIIPLREKLQALATKITEAAARASVPLGPAPPVSLANPTMSTLSKYKTETLALRMYLSSLHVAISSLTALLASPAPKIILGWQQVEAKLERALELSHVWEAQYSSDSVETSLRYARIAEADNVLVAIVPWISLQLREALMTELVLVNRYQPGRPDVLLVPAPYLSYSDGATGLISQHDPRPRSLGYWSYSHRLGERDECTFPDGKHVSLRQSCLEAISIDSGNAFAFNGLAFSIRMGSGESVALPDGRKMDAGALYKEAARLNPNYCHPYYNLGYINEGDVVLNGRTYNREQLYVEAIRCDSNYLFAYYNLAYNMTDKAIIMLRDGRALTRKQMYIEAIRCDPHYAFSYNNLANLLADNENVVLHDGRRLNSIGLYVEALRWDPDYAYAYNNVANALSAITPGQSLKLHDGRELSERELYMQAIRCNANYAYAYHNLALCLRPDETVPLIDGRMMTRVLLFVEALKHEPDYENAMGQLRLALGEGETVQLHDGRVVQAQAAEPEPISE